MKQSNDEFEMKEEYDFSEGIRGRFYFPKKISTTIRLDDDVLRLHQREVHHPRSRVLLRGLGHREDLFVLGTWVKLNPNPDRVKVTAGVR